MRISDWSSDVCSSDLPLPTSVLSEEEKVWIPLSSAAASEICVVSASLRAESWSRLTAYCAATSDETRLGVSIPEPLLSEVRICDVAEAVGLVEMVVVIRKIGRASCRERGCQYV